MRVCVHRGLVIAVLTRNEHCPPHVHVGTDQWDARFEFSFWHNGIRLWDVLPADSAPSAPLLEELRQAIKQRANLQRARELWWTSRKNLCLDNQCWDAAAQEVVSPKAKRRSAVDISSGYFDASRSRTVLMLAGQTLPLEIQL
jgi:hypothetical protein